MKQNNPDLDNNAPDKAKVALLIIDMINDLEFPGGEKLAPRAIAAAEKIAGIKAEAKRRDVPVIFANDNFGRWRSNFQEAVESVLHQDVRGRPLAELLCPSQDDYFVLKPKHSAFFATPLELLLQHLQCRKLILCGTSGNMCVQFTAVDAYMRDYDIYVLADCIASESEHANARAITYMKDVLKAHVLQSDELDLENFLA